MNNKPKTIKILLADGTPAGIKIAEIGGRAIEALLIPRNKIKEASVRIELNSVGIYFLIGHDLGESLPTVYIGEAEKVYNRLLQHNKDTQKDFWNVACCFISTNKSINKAHVKYLEGYCFELAQKIKRANLSNSTAPAKTLLPETDEADALDFFENIKLLISTLGYPIFDDVNIIDTTEKIYICKGPNAEAKGKYSDEGLIVYEGSTTRRELTKTAGSWVKNMIDTLLLDKVLIEKDQKSFIFAKNFIFNSPSAAAAVILARRANGWIEWKDEDNKTLDQNERS